MVVFLKFEVVFKAWKEVVLFNKRAFIIIVGGVK